jgi:hypothetical protein
MKVGNAKINTLNSSLVSFIRNFLIKEEFSCSFDMGTEEEELLKKLNNSFELYRRKQFCEK